MRYRSAFVLVLILLVFLCAACSKKADVPQRQDEPEVNLDTVFEFRKRTYEDGSAYILSRNNHLLSCVLPVAVCRVRVKVVLEWIHSHSPL